MSLRGDVVHHVSLDGVITTVRDAGADMSAKYEETSRGGLPVDVIRC
jgi:L-serine deaminase